MKKLSEYMSQQKQYADIACMSPSRKILVLRRANYIKKFGGYWGLPGGTFDMKRDKTLLDTAINELEEETGISLSDSEKASVHELWRVEHDDKSSTTLFILYLERECTVKLSREHSLFKWVDTTDGLRGKLMPQLAKTIEYMKDNKTYKEI